MSFVHETLGVDPSKCGAHITCKARKQQQHREIFKTREAYDTLYEWLFRASKYPRELFRLRGFLTKSKNISNLMEQDQREAAVWFESNMTRDNGKWMLAQGFLGSSNNNMGQESFYKYMKKATSGKMGVSLAFFTGAMCRYMKDICDEQVSEASKCKQGWLRHAASLFIAYNQCQLLGRCVVHECRHPSLFADVREFKLYNNTLSEMEQAYQTAHPDCRPSVPVVLYDSKSHTSLRFAAHKWVN